MNMSKDFQKGLELSIDTYEKAVLRGESMSGFIENPKSSFEYGWNEGYVFVEKNKSTILQTKKVKKGYGYVLFFIFFTALIFVALEVLREYFTG